MFHRTSEHEGFRSGALLSVVTKTNNNVLLSFDANVSSFSLAESPPRDLQITAYK